MINKIICGDTLEVLKTMPDGSVDCIITSPPYWGLRQYGWINVPKGLDKEHRHEKVDGKCECGALFVEGMLGLEPTIQEHIANMMAIMTECKRVLADYGTLWLNYGDTYAGSGVVTAENITKDCIEAKKIIKGAFPDKRPNYRPENVQRKSMCLVPERVSIAMVDDGWVLRNKIVWHKPSVLPQSAKDRFTNDWEYIYFFTKKPKYYFEQQFEESKSPEGKNLGVVGGEKYSWHHCNSGKPVIAKAMRNCRSVWKISSQSVKEAHFAAFPFKLIERPIIAGCPELVCTGKKETLTRGELIKIFREKKGMTQKELENVVFDRDIAATGLVSHWERGDMFPEEDAWTKCKQILDIDVCSDPIRKRVEFSDELKTESKRDKTAGVYWDADNNNRTITSVSLIDGCGQPVRKEIEREQKQIKRRLTFDKGNEYNPEASLQIVERKPTTTATHCSCGSPFRKGIVLDPFMGSGTTAIVARALDRDYIGIELNPEYIEMAQRRLEKWPKELVLEKLSNGNNRVKKVEREEETMELIWLS